MRDKKVSGLYPFPVRPPPEVKVSGLFSVSCTFDNLL
jgi:hypothetical protein